MFDFTARSARPVPAVFAHRGASRLHHENTLDAFQAAIDLGVDGIEFDVRRTIDRVMVVHHNARIHRSSRWIRNLEYSQVLRLANRRGYHVPTLEETLRLCAGKVALDIELKEPGYEAEVVALTARYCDLRHVAFTSFSSAIVSALRALTPSPTVGLIVGILSPAVVRPKVRGTALAARIHRLGAAFVAPHYRLVTDSFARKMSIEGLPILVWTVNYRSAALRLARRGVAAIVTDVPERILPALRQP